jgi:tetratricopeptide (TPR) repeat protein
LRESRHSAGQTGKPANRGTPRDAPGETMMQEARTATAPRKKTPPPALKPGGAAPAPAPGMSQIFQHYQAAMQLLQQGKFEKAQAAFEKLIPTAPPELLERCKMYLATCLRQMEKPQLTFLTPEEHYDYAVSQLNTGYYEEAREQFLNILSGYPNADYAYYGLALLDAIVGHAQECLENLSRAIELNPRNRLQARVDNDFQTMVDDPRFTELLYPEIP